MRNNLRDAEAPLFHDTAGFCGFFRSLLGFRCRKLTSKTQDVESWAPILSKTGKEWGSRSWSEGKKNQNRKMGQPPNSGIASPSLPPCGSRLPRRVVIIALRSMPEQLPQDNNSRPTSVPLEDYPSPQGSAPSYPQP